MKFKKVLSAALSAAMAVTMLTACGTNKKTADGGMVTLKYVMCAPGKQEDSDRVWAEWNKTLQEKLPNVQVEFEVIPLSEFRQSFSLMLASNETMDIVNNYGLDFATEVENGTFAPLNELVAEYGQDLTAALPEWFMEYQKINGEIYGIPTYQMCANMRGMVFIKEYADKYLDLEGFTKALHSSQRFNDETLSYLDDMLAKMKADGIKYKTVSIPNIKGAENIVSSYSYIDGKVMNYYASEEMKNVCLKRARDWYTNGYIREDVVGATDTSNYEGKKDGLPFWDTVWTPYVQDNLSAKYGIELITVPYSDKYFIDHNNTAGGTSIMSSSKHKEEAMQVINLLNSDKELYNMLVYGIEGEHYTKVGDDRIETVSPTGQATANDKYGLYKWIVGNTELAYQHQLEPDGYKEWVFEEVNSSDYVSDLMGFVPDISNIETELSQVEAVNGEFYADLVTGAFENWEERYDKWQKKLELAGDKKICEELQKQIDEFLKNNK